jgi:hypothetical protein
MEVLGWGWNCFQQIAEDVPNVIEHLRVFGEDMKDGEETDMGEVEGGKREEKKIVGIGCSWDSSWVITRDGSLFIFGEQICKFQTVKYS